MADIETTPVTDTGNQVVGKVSILYGTVKAMSPDGTVRVLDVNSLVYADDRIITESDGSVSIVLDDPAQTHLDIGRMSDIVIDEDVYGGAAPEDVADAAAEVEEIQNMLLAGDDTGDIEMEATAAGGTSAAGGGHPVFKVDATGNEVTPDAFAETEGWVPGTQDTIPGINEEEVEPEPEPEPLAEPEPPANNPPEIVVNADGIGDTAYEAGLPTGSDDASDSEFAAGSFTISDSDGLDDIDTVTIAGITFTRGVDFTNLGDLVGETFDIGYGTVELTSYADGTFGYAYTLDENVDNDTQPGATDAGYDESFDVSVSDGDASATATITLSIVDDVPTAIPDPAAVDVNDGESSASATLASLIAETGADDASVTHVNGGAIAEGVPVGGTYGELTVSGGSYSYTAYEGVDTTSASDSFTFTVTDGDGDTDTVDVTFNVLDNEGPSVEVVADSLTVDETGIDGTDDVAPGDDIGTGGPSDNSESTNGTLNIGTGGDPYELYVNNILIPVGGTSIQGLYGDLTINAAGVWSYTLDDNYLGHTPGDPNDLAPGVDNFNIAVTDDSGTFPDATTTLSINILDDGPVAASDPAEVDVNDGASSAPATLASLIAETGADGASVTHVNSAPIADGVPVAGTYGELTVSGGSYSYTAYENFTNPPAYTPDSFEFTVTDGDGDTDTVSVSFDVVDNEAPSVSVVADSLTVDETGIDGTDDVAPGDDIGTGGSSDNSESTNGTLNIQTGGDAYELYVGTTLIPSGGTSIQGLYGDLTINAAGVWSYTLDDNYLDHLPPDHNDLASGVDNFQIKVTDDSGMNPDATTTLSINILDDGPVAAPDPAEVDVNDGASSAPATLASLIAETGADGASVTHLNGVAIADGVPVAGTYGTLTVSGGSYSYTAYENFTNPPAYTPDSFEFTVTDGDGDTDTVSVSFDVVDNEAPSVSVVADTLTVDESGIDGTDDVAPLDDIGTQPSADTESINGTLNIGTGGDAAYELYVGTTLIPVGGTTIQGLYGDLTINAAGVWSYTLDDNYLGHAAGDPNDLAPGVENFGITVTDDSGMNPDATTTLSINILDDGPAVIAPDEAHILDGGSGGENINFVAGADGVGTVEFNVDSLIGQVATDTGGRPLSLNGAPLTLHYGDDGADKTVLVAKTAAGAIGFTIDIDPTTGTYSIDANSFISNGTAVTPSSLQGVGGGNYAWDTLVDIGGTSQDVVITTVLGNTVNTSSHSFGVGNGQSIDATEGLRLDFVNGVVVTGSGMSKDYTYDTGQPHNLTSFYSQEIAHLVGSGANLTVTAILADNDYDLYLRPPSETGETIIDLNPLTDITVYNNLGVEVTGLTIDDNADGSVTIHGLQKDWTFEVDTGDDQFSAIQIDGATGTGAFKLGFFTYGEESPGDPVELSYAVTGTDGDGDTTDGFLDATIYPEVDAEGDGEDNVLLGTDGADDLDGLAGADILAGGKGADDLDGGAGDDELYGGSGNDILVGGAGEDMLHGGSGDDTLTGGADKDTFKASVGNDTIMDYDKTTDGDLVDISELFDGIAPDNTDTLGVSADGLKAKLTIFNQDGAERGSITFNDINYADLTTGDELDSLLAKVDVDSDGDGTSDF